MPSIPPDFRSQIEGSIKRVSLSAPQSIALLQLLVPLFALDLILSHYDSTALLGIIGILIEIAGAILIAVPEIDSLDDYTRAGKLRYALNSMSEGYGFPIRQNPDSPVFGGMSSVQEIGTPELIDLFRRYSEEQPTNTTESEHQFSATRNYENVGYIDIKENPPRTIKDPEARKSWVNHGPWMTIFGDEPGETVATIICDFAEREIEEEIRHQEGGFVRFGAFLLVIGFSQQLISYILLFLAPSGAA